jgi:hypothetical protein
MGLQGNSEPLGGHWQYLVMGQPHAIGGTGVAITGQSQLSSRLHKVLKEASYSNANTYSRFLLKKS